MAAGSLRPSSIAARAITFLEQHAKRQCLGHTSDVAPSCLPCQAREVLGYDPRGGKTPTIEYVCPECDIGHHERCSSAHCECDCP